MKKLGIVKNDPITGVEYGMIDAPEMESTVEHDNATHAYAKSQLHAARRARKMAQLRTKHK